MTIYDVIPASTVFSDEEMAALSDSSKVTFGAAVHTIVDGAIINDILGTDVYEYSLFDLEN